MNGDPTLTVLNGPPGCGKDTIARAISEREDTVIHKEFKSPLYEWTREHYDVYHDAFIAACKDSVLKERPYFDVRLNTQFHETPREMLIHVAENVIKPLKGADYLGKVAGQEWVKTGTAVISSDGGFPEEINACVAIYPPEAVLVIQLHRDDFTFHNDSRDYISPDDVECNVVRVQLRDGDIERAVADVQRLRAMHGV